MAADVLDYWPLLTGNIRCQDNSETKSEYETVFKNVSDSTLGSCVIFDITSDKCKIEDELLPNVQRNTEQCSTIVA